jgi:hypothetical protein
MYAEHLGKTCEHYRYVMPRPKVQRRGLHGTARRLPRLAHSSRVYWLQVYRYCKDGFDESLHEMCPKVCAADPGTSHTKEMNDRSHQVCKWTKEMTPRPQAYQACTKGYEAGFRNAVAFAKHTHLNHNPSKTTQADLAGDANAEEKAAEAEADKSASAATAAIKAKAAAAAKAASDAELKKIADDADAKKESSKPASADELKNARAAARAAYAKEQARKKSGDSGVDV